jgi:hypothetical protein
LQQKFKEKEELIISLERDKEDLVNKVDELQG